MSTSVKPAHHTPTSFKDGGRGSDPQKLGNPQAAAGLALNLSWQLLIVLGLFLWGGHWLDQKFGSAHWFMASGFLLAALAMILLVRNTMKQLNELNGTTEDKE